MSDRLLILSTVTLSEVKKKKCLRGEIINSKSRPALAPRVGGRGEIEWVVPARGQDSMS